MWAFQPHFRIGLEHSTRDVFNQIGFGLGARAYLVGFANDASTRFPTCFEPETDPLASVDLADVVQLAEKRYAAHPERQIIITSGLHHDRFHRYLRDKMRAEVLRDLLQAHPLGAGQHFFVGASALVEGYEVHPVIALPRKRWQSKPTLTRVKVDRYTVEPSFQHAVLNELLERATKDLSQRDAPEDFSLRWLDRSEIVRQAARRFVQSVSLLAGHTSPSELTVALDEVSAQPYEGRSSAGGFILAREDSPHVDVLLRFERPIRLSETRGIRKALEMTGDVYKLLCDGEKVLALARLGDGYDGASESVFQFDVVSRGTWELRHHGTSLLRVTNTRPVIPSPRLDSDHFRDVVTRTFSECSPTDVDRLWELASASARAKHGTMLVVHREAAEEAERMLPQSQKIAASQLSLDAVDAVTRIDGAVLVDLTGRCHAVGVILDGRATGSGDASRGARFNSAIRYEEAQHGKCLVIVVSEDGMINMLPRLRRRVRREAVEGVVGKLEFEVQKMTPDYERFFRHWEHLETLSFYLNKQQCHRVNAARRQLEEHRRKHSQMSVSWSELEPNADMNDSYFLGD